MYSYRAYGLGFHSEYPLFDLPVRSVTHDVVIIRERIEPVPVDAKVPFPYLKLDPQEAILAIEGIGRFRVTDSCHIGVDPDTSAGETQINSYLLGIAMALLLYQRKRLLLHASVIMIDQKAVAFLGDSGAGKSSIAAAFLAKGYKLLTDDLASMVMDEGNVWVDPGFPFIKLSSEALSLFSSNPEQLVLIDKIDDKTLCRFDKRTIDFRIPLKQIYIIKLGEEVVLEPLNSQQALLELMRFSIPPSMVRLNHVTHFERLVKIVNKVQVYGLRRPESINHLSQLVRKVEENIP